MKKCMETDNLIAVGKFVVSLLQSVLEGVKPIAKPDEISWEAIFAFSKLHGVENMVCYAIENMEKKPDDIIWEKFKKEQNIQVARSLNQEFELNTIISDFESENVDCMLLKGCVMRELYPSADMRVMADLDILIKEDMRDIAEKIMKKNGYVFETENAHEIAYLKRPYMYVELHKSIVPNYNKELYKYYGTGWKFARPLEGYKHINIMSDEDFFVFMIAHFAKHYIQSGIGIRHVMDVYVYYKSKKLNSEYVKKELEKLELYEFSENVISLARSWFDGESSSDVVQAMELFVLKSGSYGIEEHRINYHIIENEESGDLKEAKKKRIMKLVFPSMDIMKKQFPILNMLPFLYPIMAIFRVVRALLFRKSSVLAVSEIAKQKINDVDEYKKHCSSVGLHKIL